MSWNPNGLPELCGHCDKPLVGDTFRIPECCAKSICADCVADHAEAVSDGEFTEYAQ